ncbi:MAG: thioredoxin family protein [Actinomycetota bacterium]
MLVRFAIVFGVLAFSYALFWLWRRPSRRLRSLDLKALGIGGPAIVQFSTKYCSPCKAAAPHLRAAAEETNVAFAQIDVGERPEIARRYGIRSVPTIAVTDRVGRVLGAWTSLPSNGEIAAAAWQAHSGRPGREARSS